MEYIQLNKINPNHPKYEIKLFTISFIILEFSKNYLVLKGIKKKLKNSKIEKTTMIKNYHILEKIEKKYIKNNKQNLIQNLKTNLKIFQSMLDLQKELKIYTSLTKDLEIDIKYARTINGFKKVT